MHRTSDKLTLDILRACPDILTNIMRNVNVNTSQVKRLVDTGLLEKRLVNSDGWSENRNHVYVYFHTEEGRELLENGE